ncbi:MAG: hypothetical protein AAFX05_13850 [Planctomycetota bacterium]
MTRSPWRTLVLALPFFVAACASEQDTVGLQSQQGGDPNAFGDAFWVNDCDVIVRPADVLDASLATLEYEGTDSSLVIDLDGEVGTANIGRGMRRTLAARLLVPNANVQPAAVELGGARTYALEFEGFRSGPGLVNLNVTLKDDRGQPVEPWNPAVIPARRVASQGSKTSIRAAQLTDDVVALRVRHKGRASLLLLEAPDIAATVMPKNGLRRPNGHFFKALSSLQDGIDDKFVRVEMWGARKGTFGGVTTLPIEVRIPNVRSEAVTVSVRPDEQQNGHRFEISGYQDAASATLDVTLRDPDGQEIESWSLPSWRTGKNTDSLETEFVPITGKWAALRISYRGFETMLFLRG